MIQSAQLFGHYHALQTNPMRPILKKNEIRRTTFPRTQSQAFPGISL